MRDLRNIYKDKPDLEKKGIEFNEKYKKERTNKDEYEITRARNRSNYWRKFKFDFNEYTQNRCPICERQVSQYDDIEHYRPQKDYWWLAYNFYNYYNCCKLCNTTYKSVHFPLFDESKKVNFATKANISAEEPLLFNPLEDDPLKLFYLEFIKLSPRGYYPDFKIIPNPNLDKSSYEHAKAEKTIELFNLNNENFKSSQARLDTIADIAISLWDFKEKIEEWSKESDIEQKAKKGQKVKESYARCGLFLFEFVWRGLYIGPTKSV